MERGAATLDCAQIVRISRLVSGYPERITRKKETDRSTTLEALKVLLCDNPGAVDKRFVIRKDLSDSHGAKLPVKRVIRTESAVTSRLSLLTGARLIDARHSEPIMIIAIPAGRPSGVLTSAVDRREARQIPDFRLPGPSERVPVG